MDGTLKKRIADLEEKEKILDWLIGRLMRCNADGEDRGRPVGMMKRGEEYQLFEDVWWPDEIYTLGYGVSPIDCIKDAM